MPNYQGSPAAVGRFSYALVNLQPLSNDAGFFLLLFFQDSLECGKGIVREPFVHLFSG